MKASRWVYLAIGVLTVALVVPTAIAGKGGKGGGKPGGGRLDGVSESTLRDFEEQCESPADAPRGLAPGVPVYLLDVSWIKHLAVGGGGTIWKRVHERLGTYGGFLELSAVGFNEDLTQAVVRVGRAFGDLAGTGYEYLLERRDGAWHVVDEDLVWVS